MKTRYKLNFVACGVNIMLALFGVVLDHPGWIFIGIGLAWLNWFLANTGIEGGK